MIRIAEVAIGTSFSDPVAHVLGNAKVEVAEVFISIAEIAIGTPFSGPVADVPGNSKVFLVVVYCSLEAAEVLISIAEIATGTSFSGRSTTSLAMLRSFSWYSILLLVGSRLESGKHR